VSRALSDLDNIMIEKPHIAPSPRLDSIGIARVSSSASFEGQLCADGAAETLVERD